jgi:DNA polymerase elongation subunit (family B)
MKDDDDDNEEKPLEFRLFDFQTRDQMGTFIVEAFGINEKGKSVFIKVTDFEPFFYILVDDKWTNKTVKNFILQFIELQNNIKNASQNIKGTLHEYNKLYGFSGDKKSRFLCLTFKTIATYYKTRNIWYNADGKKNIIKLKETVLEIYETKIPPLLRFFHINQISPSGWIALNRKKCKRVIDDEMTTTCTFEFICCTADIIPKPEKETRVPYKIASFDIEASSSHGDFPLPVKTYKKLATQMVDIISKRDVNDISLLKQYIKRIILTAFSFDKFENVDLVYPKCGKIAKGNVVQLIERFINNPIIIDNAKIDQLSKTENCLSEWISQNNATLAKKGDDDDDLSSVDTLEFEDNDDEMLFEPAAAPRISHATAAAAAAKKSMVKTIVITDILLNKTGEIRESRIKQVNESLMAVFPELEGDKVTFIGTTFTLFGEKEPYLNNCLVLGTCDSIEGIEVETFKTEYDLLLGWTQLIQMENPDIIIGYNIFGFDYEFLYQRARQNDCEMEFLELSRKKGDICAKFDSYDIETREMLGIESTKVVLASGEYDLRYVKMAGRLQIDMYAYLRRDFNLSSYKLDDVAGQFICDDIRRIEDGNTLITGNLTGIHVGDYIHIEIVGITTNYIEGGRKYRICDIRENALIIDSQIDNKLITNNKLRWGIAKDDVSPQDIFRLANGTASDRAIVARYCVQDCNLVHHLLNKIDVITGYIEMSNICNIPISFLVFRGQGIKLTSYVAKKCREKDTLIPDLDSSFGNDEGYEGAIVLPPKCSMYMDNPVACVDYASLYPSSMISNNLSPDSKIWTKEYDLDGKLVKEWSVTGEASDVATTELPPEYGFVDVEFDTFQWRRHSAKSRATKVKTGKKVCRFAQFPEGRRAILPAILEELLKARKETRNRIKGEPDAFMRNILDKRQLAYKMTANSLYGQCGSKTSTFFEKDVAAATTATGRMMIIYAKRIIEEVYGDLLYNTESHGPVCCRAEYVYGDSVANYTPIWVRDPQHQITLLQIDELAKHVKGVWKPCIENGRQTKDIIVCPIGFETWTENGWTPLRNIIRHPLASHKKMIRVITDKGLVDVTDDHSLLRAFDATAITPKECVIGTPLLHHRLPPGMWAELVDPPSNNIRMAFWQIDDYIHQFMCHTDGDEPISPLIFEYKSQIECAHIWYYATSYGLEAYLDGYFIEISHPFMMKMVPIQKGGYITDMYEIVYDGGEYVYDLTTENHHFAAGIGEMIVHNTDSVFFTFNLQSPEGEPIRGKDALEITIEIAQDVAKLCTQYLKAPMELTYEKTLMPFILLSKKRYVGMLFEDEAKGDGKLKYMGLSIKRRDSCDYLKEIYGRVLAILMKEQNVMEAVKFLRKSLRDLIDGNVPLEKLIITKALRSDYKKPETIAHKVLADRIGERDPGNKPKSGDRIKFLYVQPNAGLKGKILMGDRIETPDFVISGKAKIDYMHYVTNQLMNPMTQLFGLALEQIYSEKVSRLSNYHKVIDGLKRQFTNDLENFNKQKEKYCSNEIERLIYTPILNEIANIVNRQNNIMWKSGGAKK